MKKCVNYLLADALERPAQGYQVKRARFSIKQSINASILAGVPVTVDRDKALGTTIWVCWFSSGEVALCQLQ
ncbi:hypothetical protein [Aeromonas hydrophila]|uniref:hypothetical protein n=1 Tax=Aeromonas hydrophila TaxID=644 RepID=UPI002B4890B3|nr:hypothetical protein [Aeromonas hydrophila]